MSGEAGRTRIEEIAGEDEFRARVIEPGDPILVVFSAVWCAPCAWLPPYVEAALREAEGSLAAVKVDVDRDPAIADRFRVGSVPTVVYLRGGEELDRSVGIEPERLMEMARRSRR